ncbi:hypothetical protein D7V91_00115 [bacterium 1xD42-67]|nr:hypothetical protein D7V91_00115 [bacterium 1xD42-67]
MSEKVLTKSTSKKAMRKKTSPDILDVLFSVAPSLEKSIADMANDYLEHYGTKEKAAKKLINDHIVNVATTGTLSGILGTEYSADLSDALEALLKQLHLPIATFIQLRMVAGIATLGGFDLRNEEVKGKIYLCLLTSTIGHLSKKPGKKITEKIIIQAINAFPVKDIQRINKVAGFRLVTKKGKTGAINLIDLVPAIVILLSVGIDAASTKLIASNAYTAFISTETVNNNDKEIIVIEKSVQD